MARKLVEGLRPDGVGSMQIVPPVSRIKTRDSEKGAASGRLGTKSEG